MFRQMAKLHRAQTAFREGRIEEALGLAEDPEIRDHLKAETLRRRCLDALEKRAKERAEEGDLSGAARALDDVARREGRDEAARHAGEIRDRQAELADAKERARARYFRARLEFDRGDLDLAAEILTAGGEAPGEDASKLLALIEERRQRADQEVRRATELSPEDLPRAEEALARAVDLHPRSPALKRAAIELARARIARVAKGSPSDGALASFLLEHGLLKRRLLAQMNATEQRDVDEPLNAIVRQRVEKHLERDRLEVASRLLERRRENLAPDPDLDAKEEAIKGILAVGVLAARGEFESAEQRLESARRRLGKNPAIATAAADLAEIRERVEPSMQRAEAAFAEGALEDAKEAALAVVAAAPEHAAAQRLLRALNEGLRERVTRMAEAYAMIDRRRLDEATDLLLGLRGRDPGNREIELALKEVEMLHRLADRRRGGSATPSAPLELAALTAEPDERRAEGSDARWVLGVEEHGEWLVLEKDVLVIGNRASGEADLAILAPLASRHARLSRRTSFHGGCQYEIEALDEAEMRVNGGRTARHRLQDGDRVRLGRDFEMTFRRPSARSGAARLDLGSSFAVRGCGSLLLMPSRGRSGSILVGAREDAHVRTADRAGEIEIYRDPAGRLLAASPRPFSIDGTRTEGEAPLDAGSAVRSEDLVVSVARA